MEVLSYPLPHPAATEPPTRWARSHQECPVTHVALVKLAGLVVGGLAEIPVRW
jgi:hypothetical protein